MKGKRFGPTLAKLRKEKGYASPYAFFKASGGPRGLGVTFAGYLALEKGTSLPQPRRLGRLVSVLGPGAATPAGKSLLEAYLSDHLGDEDMVKALSGPAAHDPAPGSWTMAENLSREAWKNSTSHLSVEQLAVITGDPKAYACHLYAKTTRGSVSRAELAKALGCSVKALNAPLAALEKAGLMKLSGTSVTSPYAGLLVPLPPPSPATASLIARLAEFKSRWAESRGRKLHATYLFLRTTEDKIKTYQPHLDQAVNMAAVYLENERKPGTAIYLVEGQVTRLFD